MTLEEPADVSFASLKSEIARTEASSADDARRRNLHMFVSTVSRQDRYAYVDVHILKSGLDVRIRLPLHTRWGGPVNYTNFGTLLDAFIRSGAVFEPDVQLGLSDAPPMVNGASYFGVPENAD